MDSYETNYNLYEIVINEDELRTPGRLIGKIT